MREDTALLPKRGLTFEELQIGFTFTSPGRKVSEADVNNFAALTGDRTPIHIDAEYAARHPFGQRVAHGMLGLSLATALAIETGYLADTLLAFRAIEDWKFSLPIYLEDSIHIQAEVTAVKPVPRLGGGLVTLQINLLNQNQQTVQQGSWSVLVKSQPK